MPSLRDNLDAYRWRVRHYLGSITSQEDDSPAAAKDVAFQQAIGNLPPKPPAKK